MKKCLHQFLHDARRSFSLFFLLACGVMLFTFAMGAVYPSVRDQMRQALSSVPAFFRPLIAEQLGAQTFEGFVSLAFNHPFLLGMFGIWAIALAAGAVAGEIERGTLGLVLSYPFNRQAFLAVRTALLYGGLLLLSLSIIPGFWIAFRLFGVSHAGLGPYLWASLATFLLYGAIAALTLWSSAASSGIGGPVKLGTTLLLGSFFLNYLAQLWPPFQPYRWVSLFAYYNPKGLLLGKPMEGRDLLVLSLVTLVGIFGAFRAFGRRDLSI